MIRFYAPDIEQTHQLPESESAHCCKVLRKRAGDVIEVTDGKGNLYECEVLDAHSKGVSVAIINKTVHNLHWNPSITLAVAPTKNMDRMEWLAEKAVEIGVNKLIFVNCHNSVRKVVKRDRIEKILISAMKQSLKSTLPEFIEMISFRDFIANDISSMKFVGYCDENIDRLDFADSYDGKSDVTILIGPEGDFTGDEITFALNKGFRPVTFGNTRLRTETAALYGLCATHTIISQQQ